MKTFSELLIRLAGLSANLDGELWDSILSNLNPPEGYPNPAEIQDLAFRDAKAFTGYVPDLRNIMKKNAPSELSATELQNFRAILGFYNLSARLPVLLLSIPDHKETEQLIDLYNGFRQILLELNEYHKLASV
ncbi:MAG: hypothetical protein LBF22_02550 [Deltaproteobacteria bacterium]|jgi:hypothetical protein|nr:hypothetical protein [Deltaproteobacteria bacterium]